MKTTVGAEEAQNFTKDILVELLRPLLKDAISEALQGIEMPKPPDLDLLNIDQAAEFLSVSKDYIYRRTANNEIPCFRKGKRIYLSRKRLTEWLKEGGE